MTSPDRTVPDETATTPDAAVPGPTGSGTEPDAGDVPAAAEPVAVTDVPGGPVAGASPLPLTGELVPPNESTSANDELSGTIAALTADDLDQSERRKLLGRLAGQIRLRQIGDLFRPKAAIRWVADTVSDVAPRLPIRDRETLRRHFPGQSDEAIAERLIRNAALTTAAVGATSGGVAAIEWVATPTLLSAPVLLAAETVVVVAVEIKLIGELHEVYGTPVSGTGSQRAVALVQAWAHRRGIEPVVPGGIGLAAVLGTAARKELRDRLLRRFGRNLTTYGPMLTGAAVASYLNRRATISLGQQIRKDLERGHGRAAISQTPTQPPSRD
jgi:uncharacterized protein (DUF697 family)